MKFEDFISEEKRRLEAFEKFWRQQNHIRPDLFPMDCQEGQWDEQYNVFDETLKTFQEKICQLKSSTSK